MAAPIKDGLDYFPEQVEISNEVYMLEAEYGIEGYGILLRLKAWIFKNSYYLKWDKAQQLIFSRREGVDINTLLNVVNACINYGLFDSVLYQQYVILTSKSIQSTYLTAVSRRMHTLIIREYLLVDINEYNNGKNNIIIVSINSVNDDNNQQSKVKESKVKESKVNTYDSVFSNKTPEMEFDRRFDAFRKEYNLDANKIRMPQYQYLLPSRDDMEFVSRVFTTHSHEECIAAWKEYFFICSSKEYKAFPQYKTMIGFIKSGVDIYDPKINPRESMKIHPGNADGKCEESDRIEKAAKLHGLSVEDFKREAI